MYQAVHATSVSIQRLLLSAITADAFLAGPTGPFTTRGMTVLLNTPEEMLDIPREGVSLWLYRVVRDEHRLNEPSRRISASEWMRPPLPLRLHYLVTPVTTRANLGDPDTEQYLLGKVMQTLHSRAVLRGADLQAELSGTDTELHVQLETLTLDETSRMWEALGGSYQLCVSYEVSLVAIDTAVNPESQVPVSQVISGIGQIVGAP
ncbi:MAG: DUF4255 domain-containing protein [Acidobacteria bacterium]|nr:MAG: DUF4255 domain-containing protein [Acidobacteriota bacterium]